MKTLKSSLYCLLTGFILLTLMFFVTPETDYQNQQRFLECSINEGDAGCDSCYYLIYGKHIDFITGEEVK